MRSPKNVLESLTSKAANKDYHYKRLYRNLYNPAFFLLAYERIQAKPGNMTAGSDGKTIDGMSMKRIETLIEKLKDFSYQPKPARRTYIPKANGKTRPLGIPAFNDKLVQEVIRMILESIYEPTFQDTSHGFRPKRSCHTALQYIKRNYTGVKWFVEGDIKGCFDHVDHHVLIQILRRRIADEHFIGLIWKFLKAGYMENWVYYNTYSGTPQGSLISPILANIYLNEFDQEFVKRGVPCIRYADDIVLLAKSKRASERLLESSTKYLEEKLKLTVNRKKSRTVSVFAIRNFKYLGFALGRNGTGIYVRVHPKSWRKFKSRLKELSSRKRCQSIKPSLEKIKIYARGWLNYYGIASMKNNIEEINGWLYHRIRMCIWKQWKLPRTKKRNLIKMGVHEYYANMAANCRRGHWYCANLTTVKKAMTKERLINGGFYDLATAYQSVHVNY